MKEAERRLSFIGDPATRNLVNQLLEVIRLQATEIETLQLKNLQDYLKQDVDLAIQ